MRIHRLRQRIGCDDGMVTAETAVVMPVLLIFGLVVAAVVMVAQAKMRCADLARESVRAAARGASFETHGPAVILSRNGDSVSATVELVLRPVPWLPAVTVTETATANAEPSATDRP